METEGKIWAQEVALKIIKKEQAVAWRNKGRIPYLSENHRFQDQSGAGITWWTNGFWGGMMWQLHQATKDQIYLENALDTENKMDRVFMDYNAMDHDAGFRWLPTAVADYRVTKNPRSRNRGLLAAASLAGRFNPDGRFIRAWNDWGDGRDTTGWAIAIAHWNDIAIRDYVDSTLMRKLAQRRISIFVNLQQWRRQTNVDTGILTCVNSRHCMFPTATNPCYRIVFLCLHAIQRNIHELWFGFL